jgi:hypothetical protein
MLAPPGETYELEVARRGNAINAVAAYCKIEEGDTPKGRKRSSNRSGPAIKQEDSSQSPEKKMLEVAMLSVFVGNVPKKRPAVCAWCVANEELPMKDRIHSFSTPGDLSKHFCRKHLKHMTEGSSRSVSFADCSWIMRCTYNVMRLLYMGQ